MQRFIIDAETCLESYTQGIGKSQEKETKKGKETKKVETFTNVIAVVAVEEQDTQAYVVRRSIRDVDIVFRGVDALPDMVLSTHTKLVPFILNGEDVGRVHEGFLEHYTRVRPRLIACIRELDMRGKRLRFVGHSLGACVVFLALEARLMMPQAEITCVTFGAPMMGDVRFCHYVNQSLGLANVTRIVNKNDVVTLFPFADGYDHFGSTCVINEDDRGHRGTNGSIRSIRWLLKRTPLCFFRMISTAVLRIFGAAHFHSLYTYIEGLERLQLQLVEFANQTPRES